MTPEGLRKNWGLALKGGLIDQVGDNDSLKIAADDEVLDMRGQIVLPGFVNGHNHMYGFLSHGIPTEALVTEFSSFLEDFWWPYVEDRVDHELIRLTTAWACAEMIDSGVTSFVDILEAPQALPGALEIEAEVVRQAGLNGFLSFEACQRVSPENAALGLRENDEFIRRHQNDPQIGGLMSIHTLFTCDLDFVRQAKEMARAAGASIHMHLSESVYEPDWCLKRYGKRPVEIYDEISFLDGRVLASQAVQVEAGELSRLAERGVRVVSMPLSNCEVGGGIAPLDEMLRLGLTAGLGTDGYINNFFEVMRGAFLIHKARRQNPQTLPAADVFSLATDLGAKAAGFENTGRLEEGRRADVITVKADTPTPINEHNVYDQLVLFRNPADVTNVWAGGRLLKRKGELTTIDKERARSLLWEGAAHFWNMAAPAAGKGK